ncbi:hypothetical protein [Blastococcus sp. TF02A-26]|uniref:hypothetical protein n=1 Tax=Blastococcus sp. TF02A-26 TaxID=2250577 RepID=UPI000DEA461E|nr:hypothetical protein [Blastococcus sp. TF02A-26]RBY79018.1 hypothetical protein DQ240_22715 [Blastococcus sp. TF02A-26]
MTTSRPPDDGVTWNGQARAEGGSCHGRRWAVVADQDPPTLTELLCPDGIELYRLVRDPVTHAPGLDDDGFWVYVPLGEPRPGRKILPFRRPGA